MAHTPSKGKTVDPRSLVGLKLRPDEPLGWNRRVIIALRVELEAALASGHSLRSIFNDLRAEGVTRPDYSSFRRTARTLRLGMTPRTSSTVEAPDSPPLPIEVKPPDKPAFVFERPTGGAPDFVHNPRPSKKDLL